MGFFGGMDRFSLIPDRKHYAVQNRQKQYDPFGNSDPYSTTMARLQPFQPNLDTNRGMSASNILGGVRKAGGNQAFNWMLNRPDLMSQKVEASGRSAMQPYLWGNEGDILDRYKQIGTEGVYGKQGMNDILQAYRGGMTNAMGAYSGAIDKGRQGLQRGILRGGGNASQPGMMTRRMDSAFGGAELGKAQLGADMASKYGDLEGGLLQQNLDSRMMGLQGQQGFYDTVTNRQMAGNAQELNRVNSAPNQAMMSVPLGDLAQQRQFETMDKQGELNRQSQTADYYNALNKMRVNQSLMQEYEKWLFDNKLGQYEHMRQSKVPGIIGGVLGGLGGLASGLGGLGWKPFGGGGN